MKVSKKAEYAMRAVLAIARCPEGQPVQIGELSQSESIPVKFLEQILLSLKKAGLLRSKRSGKPTDQRNRPNQAAHPHLPHALCETRRFTTSTAPPDRVDGARHRMS